MISILTINIGAAALKRAELILEWLAARPEEIFILTETSAGEGTTFLLDRFRRAGYEVVASTDFGGDRGAALVSKLALQVNLAEAMRDVSIPVRIAGAVIDSDPAVTVVGLYVPSRDMSVEKVEKKRQFLESVLAKLRRLSATSVATTVVGGDYNVIAKSHKPLHRGYLDFEFGFLDELERLGLLDAQLCLQPTEQVYSWVGRTGDGYKYDYFHVGPELNGLIEGVEYIDETRTLGLTDHSAVAMKIGGVSGRPIGVLELSVSDVQSLF